MRCKLHLLNKCLNLISSTKELCEIGRVEVRNEGPERPGTGILPQARASVPSAGCTTFLVMGSAQEHRLNLTPGLKFRHNLPYILKGCEALTVVCAAVSLTVVQECLSHFLIFF